MAYGSKHLHTGWKHFWLQIAKVIRNPIFSVLTLVGNVMVFTCAYFFLIFEGASNPAVNHYSDALWWAFVTITTVGYGDTVPVTPEGRIVAVALMLTGGVLFLSFIALLSSAFVELEFLEIKKEVERLTRRVEELLNKQSR